MGDEPLAPGKPDAALLRDLLAELPAGEGVVLGPGPGRDVAVIDPGGERYQVVTADPVTFVTDRIGRWAVTVNANDVATAGAVPRWLIATVLLPAGRTSESSLRTIQADLAAGCAALGVALIGGHTEVTDAVARPVVAATLIGDVAKDRLVRSDGAREGDVLLCTKGVPLEGAAILAGEHAGTLRAHGVPADTIAACARYTETPGLSVVADARAACEAARVHALHDPTEGGLATAVHEMADAAGLGVRLDGDALPVLAPARALCEALGLDPLGLIASGALLAAVAPEDAVAVADAVRAHGLACAEIGRFVPAAAGRTLVVAGRETPLPRYDQDEITRAP